MHFHNILVSCSNKEGLVDFLRPLSQAGARIVSTGQTGVHLQEQGLSVVPIHEQTGFREMMDGRVRTLHPHIHAPLLARKGHAEDKATLCEMNLAPFDLLICNLYPFEAKLLALQEAGIALSGESFSKGESMHAMMEFVDIGGVALLRAAAKNHAAVVPVMEPSKEMWLLEAEDVTLQERRQLAAKVFATTSRYDHLIAQFLESADSSTFVPRRDLHSDSRIEMPNSLAEKFEKESQVPLRYGENPQQSAFWVQNSKEVGWHQATLKTGS